MKIIGIGNALVDVLAHLEDDSVLKELNLERGGMTLIDDVKHGQISRLLDSLNPSMSTGGSAGNTIKALANLGMEPGFVGRIGQDKMGRFFAENCRESGIHATLLTCSESSGVANTFISKDHERTFATHLGAAAGMRPEDVKAEWFEGYDLLYLEGYLVQNHELIERVARLAKEAGLQVCIDMASYNVVRDNLEFMRHLVKDYVDIVFANEEESEAFSSGLSVEAGMKELSEATRVAVVKLGGKGSCVMTNGKREQVETRKVQVVDTTGAGDFFAAGFLYAYSQGASMEACLKCGSLVAGQVIQVVGTTLSAETWEKLNSDLKVELCN